MNASQTIGVLGDFAAQGRITRAEFALAACAAVRAQIEITGARGEDLERSRVAVDAVEAWANALQSRDDAATLAASAQKRCNEAYARALAEHQRITAGGAIGPEMEGGWACNVAVISASELEYLLRAKSYRGMCGNIAREPWMPWFPTEEHAAREARDEHIVRKIREALSADATRLLDEMPPPPRRGAL